MVILSKGTTPNGTHIQIENWNSDYSFMPYGGLLAVYPKSKVSLDGQFSPKRNRRFRLELSFNTHKEAEKAFKQLLDGDKVITDFKENIRDERYKDCI